MCKYTRSLIPLVPRSLKDCTCTHDVVPEERGPEPQWKHEQVGPQAWEERAEACGPCAEVDEGPSH